MGYNEELEIIYKHYGRDAQFIKALEELAELQVAFSKCLKCKPDWDNVIEEIADVWLMIDQIISMVGLDRKYIRKVMRDKIERVFEKIENERN